MRFPILIAFGLAIGTSSVVFAQPKAQQPPLATPVAAAQSTAIQRSVFIRDMDAQFDLIDADKDGHVTATELQGFLKVAALNAAKARNVALFKALDADGNGSLSPVEFQKLPMNLEAPQVAVSLANDVNKDTRLSKVENRAGTLANFDKMDTDKDGIVTAAEMRAAGIIK